MVKLALFVRLEAKRGKEAEVANFLRVGLQMVQEENGTPIWFALQLGPTSFGIFDAFSNETNRKAHLEGSIAKALMEVAPELLAQQPIIENIDILGLKI